MHLAKQFANALRTENRHLAAFFTSPALTAKIKLYFFIFVKSLFSSNFQLKRTIVQQRKTVNAFNACKESKLLFCFSKMLFCTAFSLKAIAQILCLSTTLIDGLHLYQC